MMRTLLPFHPAMSAVGGLLTYVLFVGAILFPQVSSDDLQNLYIQGNQNLVQSKNQLEPSRFLNYSPFLQKFVQGQLYPDARSLDAGNDKVVPQAASEQQNINGLNASNGGLSKKQWYIIGGTVVIVLLITFATIILCMCNKKRKQKKLQRALHQRSLNHPSDPPFRVPFDNAQLVDPLSDGNIVMAKINDTDSINFQENSKQNFDMQLELQENHPKLTTFTEQDNEPLPNAPAASSPTYENNAGDQNEINRVKPAAQTIVVVNNVNPTDKKTVMEGHLSDPQKKGIKDVMDNDKDIKISKLPRKRYDSESGTSDIDPKSRERHIRREYDRGYDSDHSRYGHDNAAYDYNSESRIHAHYGIPRFEPEKGDQRYLYINERSGNQIRSDGYSNDHLRQHRQQLPRRVEDYGGIDAHRMHRDNDPRKYNPKYEHRYDDRYNSQRSYSRYDNIAHVKRQSRYNELEDDYTLTIKDSRFKDPFSRDVRHELGAVIANNSFNQNDRVKSFVDAPVRRDSYTIYTSPRAPQQKYREPSRTTNTRATPVAIPFPKPDYQRTDSDELLVYKPTKKPPVLHPKPVVQTVVKPREFKGPYGPEDLDELNNPYTLARGKTQRSAIENEE